MDAGIEGELAHNLAFLRWLADRVAQASTSERRAQFLEEFGRVLDARLVAVEQHLIPALVARGLNAGMATAILSYAGLRLKMADALACDAGKLDCLEKQWRFVRLVLEHVEREHVLLLPVIRRLLTPAEVLIAGLDFKDRLQQVSSAFEGRAQPPDEGVSARSGMRLPR